MKCTHRGEEFLKNNHRLKVHSTYHHTVNVLAEGHLFAFHRDVIPSTPLSLAVPLSVPEFILFTQEAERTGVVWLEEEEQIRIRSGMFDRQAGRLMTWEDRIGEESRKESKNDGENDRDVPDDSEIECGGNRPYVEGPRTFTAILADFIKGNACPQGLSDSAVSFEKKGEDDPVTAVLREKTEILIREGTKGRMEDELFRETVRSLIGLGSGLTPSGDDFLTGMLLAFQIGLAEGLCDAEGSVSGTDSRMQTAKTGRKILNGVIRENLSRTNDISREYLLCAMEGRFGENYHELFRAKDEAEVTAVLTKIKDTGHSSGMDTLNGLLAGLKIKGL